MPWWEHTLAIWILLNTAYLATSLRSRGAPQDAQGGMLSE
jgi:hypothetical protein